MGAAQRHARTDAQVHSSRRGVDYTTGFIRAARAGAYDEALAAQRGIEHLLQGTVEVANTHMHDALSEASTFGGKGRFLHFKGHAIGYLLCIACGEVCIIVLHNDLLAVSTSYVRYVTTNTFPFKLQSADMSFYILLGGKPPHIKQGK